MPGMVAQPTRRRKAADGTKLVGTAERPVYVMVLEAMLPEGVGEEEVNTWLAPIRDELQVDITVRTIPTVEL